MLWNNLASWSLLKIRITQNVMKRLTQINQGTTEEEAIATKNLPINLTLPIIVYPTFDVILPQSIGMTVNIFQLFPERYFYTTLCEYWNWWKWNSYWFLTELYQSQLNEFNGWVSGILFTEILSLRVWKCLTFKQLKTSQTRNFFCA